MSHGALVLQVHLSQGGILKQICHLEREKALILALKREMSKKKMDIEVGR